MGILLERDWKGDVGKNYDRFVSIQSLHTEGDLIHTNVTVCFDISIHFLHTERDLARAGFHAPKVHISDGIVSGFFVSVTIPIART